MNHALQLDSKIMRDVGKFNSIISNSIQYAEQYKRCNWALAYKNWALPDENYVQSSYTLLVYAFTVATCASL